MSKNLFSSLRLGAIEIPNRVVMAPMTRCRATPEGCLTALTAEYYRQRAGAGLIISEATQVSQQGIGYPCTPGIYTREHVEAWKPVVRAVHDEGGKMYCQLWHCGRVSHNEFQAGGVAPVSSSAVGKGGEVYTYTGPKPYPEPRALEMGEIAGVIEQYRHGAKMALEAGFDGVELHGANGYLPDQFLRDGVNRRTDEWGGSIENRSRFMLEVMRALVAVWGADRVGVRLSPCGTFNDMSDSQPRATFAYVVKALGGMGLAYLHIMEAMEGDLKHGKGWPSWESIPVSYFRPMFTGPLITNAGFTKEKAEAYIARGDCDAVAFGVPYIANPDLVERFRTGAALAVPDVSTFYAGGARGYTDYPAMVKG
jgi:N-ethylmaleimide reductase